MTETQKELLSKVIKVERLDIDSPGKKQTPINADDFLTDDEDENTVAKSIVDEIIQETEREE